jgi:hypothetical protein
MLKTKEELIDTYFNLLYTYRKDILSDEYPKELLNEIKIKCGNSFPFFYSKGFFWTIYNFGESYYIDVLKEKGKDFYIPILHYLLFGRQYSRPLKVLIKSDDKYFQTFLKRELVKKIGKLYMLPMYSSNFFSCYNNNNWKALFSREVIPLELKIEGILNDTPFSIEIYKLFYNIRKDTELIYIALQNKGIVFLYFEEKEMPYINTLVLQLNNSKLKIGNLKEYIVAKANPYSSFITENLIKKFVETEIYFNPYEKWFKGKELIKITVKA